MKNPQRDHILRQMVQRLVQRFDPEQIILFGSRARGQARPNSDDDLLVVMPLTGTLIRPALREGKVLYVRDR